MHDYYPPYNKTVVKILSPALKAMPQWIKPSHLTWMNFVLSLVSALYIYLYEDPYIFLLFLLIGMLFDFIDGPLARYRNVESLYGKNLDTVLDTAAEVVIFTALFIKSFLFSWIYILNMILFFTSKLSRNLTNFDLGSRRSILFGYILYPSFNFWAIFSVCVNIFAIVTGFLLKKAKVI
jgi:phosphatidylglycerophosphate synthase